MLKQSRGCLFGRRGKELVSLALNSCIHESPSFLRSIIIHSQPLSESGNIIFVALSHQLPDEEWAVDRQRLVLASLAADVEAAAGVQRLEEGP